MFKKVNKDVTEADIVAILKPLATLADKLEEVASKAANNMAELSDELIALEARIEQQGRTRIMALKASDKFKQLWEVASK